MSCAARRPVKKSNTSAKSGLPQPSTLHYCRGLLCLCAWTFLLGIGLMCPGASKHPSLRRSLSLMLSSSMRPNTTPYAVRCPDGRSGTGARSGFSLLPTLGPFHELLCSCVWTSPFGISQKFQSTSKCPPLRTSPSLTLSARRRPNTMSCAIRHPDKKSGTGPSSRPSHLSDLRRCRGLLYLCAWTSLLGVDPSFLSAPAYPCLKRCPSPTLSVSVCPNITLNAISCPDVRSGTGARSGFSQLLTLCSPCELLCCCTWPIPQSLINTPINPHPPMTTSNNFSWFTASQS